MMIDDLPARTALPAEFGGQQRSAEPATGARERGASNKQLNFLSSLLAEREIAEDARRSMMDRVDLQVALNEREGDCAPTIPAEGVTKVRASDWIGRLLEKPKAMPSLGGTGSDDSARLRVEYKEIELDSGLKRVGAVIGGANPVLRGHYALDASDLPGDFTNEVLFLKVWVGSRGGWKIIREISDDVDHEFTSWPLKRAALLKIAEDPTAASARYGHEFERCGICGRGLRKDESRALGIGPVCAARLGSW